MKKIELIERKIKEKGLISLNLKEVMWLIEQVKKLKIEIAELELKECVDFDDKVGIGCL